MLILKVINPASMGVGGTSSLQISIILCILFFFGYAYELDLNSYPLKMPFESLRFQLRLWLQHLFEKISHVYI